MYEIINKFYNKNNHTSSRSTLFFSLHFIAIVVGVSIDSIYFAEHFFDGRWIVNILIITTFFSMLSGTDDSLHKLMIMMVPLSLLGEIIFSEIVGLYEYRLGRIPLFVPFGHAILYACGYMLSRTQWAQAHDKIMKKIFFVFFISIFLIAAIFFNDILSLVFGFLFYYYGLRLKRWNTLYYYIAMCALVGEFTGAYFGVWQYGELAFGFIPAASPPVGIVYLYLAGDALLLRIIRYMNRNKILTPQNTSERVVK